MTRIIIALVKIITTIILGIFTMSCQSIVDEGNLKTEKRSLAKFDKIEVSTGIEVHVSQAEISDVEVTAGDKIIDYIETKVDNNTLIVKFKKNTKLKNFKTAIVKINNPNYYSLKSNSGAIIKSNTTLTGDHIVLESSSGSKVDLNLEYDNVNAEVSSGSSMNLMGLTLNLNTKTSSGSSLDAKKLKANLVTADASSGSSQKVFPILELIANASSGADVLYYNNCQEKKMKNSSGGSIKNKTKS